MKKKIAIMLTFILAVGTFTSCTAEEKVNNSSLSPTVSTSVGVSVSTETSAPTNTLSTVEKKATETTEKATVAKGTEPSGQEYQNRRKSRQWAKFGKCFGNGSDSGNTNRGSEQQQEYSK